MNRPPLNICQLILIFCLAPWIACCSGINTQKDPQKTESSSKTSLAEEAFYQKNFQFISDYQSARYLFGLNQQIQESLARLYQSKCAESSSVLIANHLQSFALTTGKAQIIISKGLVSKLRSEDELFFVLAHENAHIANCDLRKDTSNHRNLEQELIADLVASNLLIATNRPMSAAYSAINRLYELQPEQEILAEHPSQTTRLKNLNQIPKDIGRILIRSNQQFFNLQLAIKQLS